MRKSMQLKAVAFAAAAALMGVSGMASASEAAQTAPSTFKPGTYTAQVNGHNAPLTVQVTVGKNRIEKIDYSKNLETIGVGRVALDIVSKKILDHQSVGVDAVTGATISSFALMQGVKDCLEARELIKLKVLESSMYNAREASIKLAEATGADCVQVIGSKFVLYLQKKKDSAYADLLK